MQLPREIRNFLSGDGEILRVFKSGPATQALLAAQLHGRGQSVVVVVPGERELAELRALLGIFLPQPDAPVWRRPLVALPPAPPSRPHPDRWARRMACLHALAIRSAPQVVLATVDNLLPRWPDRSALADAWLDVSAGEELLPEMILEQLVLWGYRRTAMVTAPGEMAMRGDILDVFAPGYASPLRLEFFGDTCETVRLFNPTTQRSTGEVAEARLLPVAPAVLSEELVATAKGKIAHLKTSGQMNAAARAHLEDALSAAEGFIFPGIFYDKPATLTDYLPPDAVYLLSGASVLRPRLEEAQWAWEEFFEKEAQESGRSYPLQAVLWPEAEARKTWVGKRQIVFEDLVIGVRREGVELPEREVRQFDDLFWKPEARQRPWAALTQGLGAWRQEGGQTVLAFHGTRSQNKFLKLAEQEQLGISHGYAPDVRGIMTVISPLASGMLLEWAGVRVLSEDVLQPGGGRKVTRERATFEGLRRYDDLREGELLVHRDYGLARFVGLQRMQVGDVANDYLLLHFSGEDKLYLPVDRMKVVQRYKGPEGAAPVLDSLRGGRWQRTKERARKAVEQIAQDLVEMYAYRKVAKGYAYGPPGELFLEFEAGFGFEETPDQAKAIQDVLVDMERSEPMDRLVCGDVGFGKTEVAMRAAFRAVLDGKQVALLCPTTVLAEQHYHNFRNRMQGFAINVAMLSRFVPKAEQKLVAQATARGSVDILIGTHRMLSQDIRFANLGLLILDEEQRFGVKHKERLKSLRKNVDALTLTATPIPRTLQLSLSGIRGLSTIETPPPERKAVETALIERDAGTLKAILERELARGGQVFWVHNRVRTLDEVEEYVRKLVPEARVASAHGQMSERLLEERMHAFWHGELDVLVCTAIVESGLDFPNANTLIVDQAQLFGLGQLYQLRGRVGRSERQAYAYFVVSSLDSLAEPARKRLQVVLDMDYLGAGFQVAMEDLRLRGAGNILGEAQSGQIARVGLDLFLEMLEEEVQRLKGAPREQVSEPEVSFVFPASIPESYMPDPGDRLRAYKALASAQTDDGEAEIVQEIVDRYGHLPEPLQNFIALVGLKRELARLGVERADLYENRAVLQWPQKSGRISPEMVLAWLGPRQDRAKLSPPAKLEVRQPASTTVREHLAALRKELGELAQEPPQGPAQGQSAQAAPEVS